MLRTFQRWIGAFGNSDTGAAWLSSARVVRCWVKFRNWSERMISHTGTETRSRLLREAAVGNIGQGSECCFIAIKGKPKRIDASIGSVIAEQIDVHSKKPDICRKQIVKLIGDIPRIELFARNKSVGWDAWGNEIKNDIEFDIFSPKK